MPAARCGRLGGLKGHVWIAPNTREPRDCSEAQLNAVLGAWRAAPLAYHIRCDSCQTLRSPRLADRRPLDGPSWTVTRRYCAR